jgi:hypothetical protein
MGEAEFMHRHQCPVRSLAAFEKSSFPDDWRDLMRLYLVRRTRSFIQENYAHLDMDVGRRYLLFSDGGRFFFPNRVPLPLKFESSGLDDQYARLYEDDVLDAINHLALPRYALGQYSDPNASGVTAAEQRQLQRLARAGRHLIGFCRTNLFKRLESGGPAFLQSLEAHILRNFVFLHAIENGLPLLIGSQDADLFNTGLQDEEADVIATDEADPGVDDENIVDHEAVAAKTVTGYRTAAAAVYERLVSRYGKRFKPLRADLFSPQLSQDLLADAETLIGIRRACGEWDPSRDSKLDALADLLKGTHRYDKVLVFTQFADTVRYLVPQVRKRGISDVAGATGSSHDPTALAHRFSPASNRANLGTESEIRVLVKTDVLSEGQNLQDCHVVINFDLPWAIIRLIQRAGRVDRIGQSAPKILCYSFLPAEGVERIINLRARLRRRLRANGEVIGTDEAFFDDDRADEEIRNLFTEGSTVLDDESDSEVDLSSQAFQIWKNAVDAEPELGTIIPAMPDVVFSTRAHHELASAPDGVLVYMRTADGSHALSWTDRAGRSVTESQLAVLNAASCHPYTPGIPRDERHHELVRVAVDRMVAEDRRIGGQIGPRSGVRAKVYDRLKAYRQLLGGSALDSDELDKAIQDIYDRPLKASASDKLRRQLRHQITDVHLANIVMDLRAEDNLTIRQEGTENTSEPRIICSLGLFEGRDAIN